MKKRIVAVTCVLMFCLGLIGCGTERANKTQQLIRGAAPGYNDGLIRVGMIQTGKESDWRDANTNDYLNTFTKERGYDLIYIDGNSSSERQVKAMYDLIQQKVDYIILQPIVETGWEDAIHAAKEAGIPVIVADRKIAVDETEYVSWIGSDFEEEGRKAVTWLDQYLTEQGRENETIHIVLLEGTEGATAAIGRTNGILHGVEEHPNWTIVDRGCANFTQGEGQTYMENLLSEGTVKDIDVIISENDNMIFGAMKALDRNGKSYGPEGDIIMISFDALHESFENMMAGKLHATVECNPLLASTVETVIEELEAGFEQKLEIIDQRLTRLESHIENVTDKNIRIVAEGHVDLNRKLNEVIHVTSDIKAYHELQNILVSDHEDRLKHII